MVLDDFFESPPKPVPLGQPHPAVRREKYERILASPVDRMAAAVADLVLVVPVCTLLIAPFSRRAKEAQLLGAEDAWVMAVIAALAIGLFAFALYQAVCVAMFGATPGKLALKLRVVSVWSGERPQPLEAFTRALVMIGELCFLGIPMLSVFSNERRRPLHDRAAETAVVTLATGRGAGLALLPEMSIFSGFQSACLSVLILVFSVNFIQYQWHRDFVLEAALKREDEGRLCTEIRETIDESPSRKTASAKDRLEVALMLFNGGAISGECLEGEAEFALWQSQAVPLAYLAKGLAIAARNESIGLDYFEKACQSARAAGPDFADVCRLTTLARTGVEAELDEDESDEAEAKLASVRRDAEIEAVLAGLGDSSQSYLKVAAIRHMLANGEVERALAQLNSLHEPRRLGAFVARERAKTLWRLGKRSEGLAAMRSVIDLGDGLTRVETASWFCQNETDFGDCGARSRSACSELKSAIASDRGYLKKPDVAAAYIRAETCGVQKPDWRELAERIPLSDAKEYLESLALIDEGNADDGKVKLQELANASGRRSAAFVLEAHTRLIDQSRSREELEAFKTSWDKLDPNDSDWHVLGRHLLVRLGRLGDWEEAIKIGFRMVKTDPGDRLTYTLMIAAAKNAGKLQMALTLLSQVPGRKPAAEPFDPDEKDSP